MNKAPYRKNKDSDEETIQNVEQELENTNDEGSTETEHDHGESTARSSEGRDKIRERSNTLEAQTKGIDRETDDVRRRFDNHPQDVSDVVGDGNCFFRCISLSLYSTQEKHKEVREKIVATVQNDKQFYKERIDGNFDQHVKEVSLSDGSGSSWATEAECLAASETYDRDIFVYDERRTPAEWFRYSRPDTCNHRRKYIKILCTGSHFKLVNDDGRPCKCRENRKDWTTTFEQSGSETLTPVCSRPTQNAKQGTVQVQDRQNGRSQEAGNSNYVTENLPTIQFLKWNGRKGADLKGIVDRVYDEVIHFRHNNLFQPPAGQSMYDMMNEMIKLITEYNVNSPMNTISLKMLMSMPRLLLQKEHKRSKTKEDNKAFARRMATWMKGEFEELLHEARAIHERVESQFKPKVQKDKAREFRTKMEKGLVRQASRLIQNNEHGGVLPLTEDTLNKLKEKHPEGAEAKSEALLPKRDVEKAHAVIFSEITGEMVKKAAIETKGSAGPSGMDADTWRRLLTLRQNPTLGNDLRTAIAQMAKKICTEECQYLEPITNSRLIPLKNSPNKVRPIGVGEVLRRIIGRCVMKVVKDDVQKAVGNLQVCAGQQAGAEAAVHAIKEIYSDSECEAILIVDAKNAFNTLNRKAMLHNINIICPSVSTYVNNTYKDDPKLILSQGEILLSREGTTQGDPIAMAVYALGLSVLQREIDYEHTSVKHSAYADDVVGAGKLSDIRKWWNLVSTKGPSFGYHPCAGKSYLIVKPDKEEAAKELFRGTDVVIKTDGEKHLGAVIGSAAFKERYAKEMVSEWVKEIQELSRIAKSEPHAAFTNFIFSMRQKWNYAMRTIPSLEKYLEPLEVSIREDFLPSLLSSPINDRLRDLLALPARLGGMGIINPVKIAKEEYENSLRLTATLTKMIVDQDIKGRIDSEKIKDTKKQISREREERQIKEQKEILENRTSDENQKRRLEMSLEKGSSNWLTTLPIREAGFSLNKQEFRDIVALRYGLQVSGLPETCACGQQFSCDHAMICKKGGFVSLRHNELRDITSEMLAEVCKDVKKEPELQPLTGEELRYKTANTDQRARLDLSARDFWNRGERAFFDIRVFDPVAPSYINQSLEAAHKRQENDKRRCYEERVINVEHASFTPIIFTIAGGMGKAAQKVFQRLADMLAESRGQPKCLVVAWMRCRLSFSLQRSAVLCLRGTRCRRHEMVVLRDTDIAAAVSMGQISVPGP